MNNYDALRDFLLRQTAAELVLSIAEIENLVGGDLPRAALRASWWETDRSPQEKMPQREACLRTDYIATRLPDGSGVKFRRRKAVRARG